MISGDSYKSYSKALFLLVALVVVLFIGTGVLKIVLSPARPIRALFGAEVVDGVQYREEQKDSVTKRLAGFWQNTTVDTVIPFVQTTDKIELKPNGIFWKVEITRIALPSGDSTSWIETATGYMRPYYHTGSVPDSISGQIHFIGKAVATRLETCYVAIPRTDVSTLLLPQLQSKPKGGSDTIVVDTIWHLVSDGKRLLLGNKLFSGYDTSGPALYSFFQRVARNYAAQHVMEMFRRPLTKGRFPRLPRPALQPPHQDPQPKCEKSAHHEEWAEISRLSRQTRK